MASKEHKIVRKAKALAELSRLSGLLAEQLKIELPGGLVTNKDAQLAEIQRLEQINELLTKVIEAGKAELVTDADDTAKKPVRSLKHGAK
jgi:pyruvate/oxaloacetate carboxyltransferase